MKVKDGTEFGRHFCSEVHAVEVTAKVKAKDSNGDGASEVRKYHLIVKSQPQNEDARRFLKPSRTFEKEVQMYGEVSETKISKHRQYFQQNSIFHVKAI